MLNFYNVFLSLCNDKGITPSRAALDCGISKVSVSNWKHKRNNPTDATLLKLADYFKVSVEYLKGEEDIKKAPDKPEELTEGEKLWLNLYNQLSAETREILINVANSFENLPTETQEFLLGAVRVALNNQK